MKDLPVIVLEEARRRYNLIKLPSIPMQEQQKQYTITLTVGDLIDEILRLRGEQQ